MLTTPLHQLHLELGAKMVPFAGYDMPVQYAGGIIQEHLHTRSAAGLFDVSHMGQVIVEGHGTTAGLEALLPADLEALPENHSVYSLLTNDAGGVRDDLIVTRLGEEKFFLVVNAACKDADIAYIKAALQGPQVTVQENQALMALQGPAARAVLSELIPALAGLQFMQGMAAELEGEAIYVTCSGYTGEDGFELSVPAAQAEAVARKLLASELVSPVGLGARDSLRLEAGLCLYGHELDEHTTPVEAVLMWSIGAARRVDGARAGGFPGAESIFKQRQEGATRRRVGLLVQGKRPVREGQRVLDDSSQEVGLVTSGAYSATLERPIAMAYVSTELAKQGVELQVDVRGKMLPVTVAPMPFVPQNYFRG